MRYTTLQKLVSLVAINIRARLHQFFAKADVTCATSQCYVNFAKTYVTCVISQAPSILQNLMTLVWYRRLCRFCKNLYNLCCILFWLCQFCQKPMSFVLHLTTTWILQKPMLIQDMEVGEMNDCHPKRLGAILLLGY